MLVALSDDACTLDVPYVETQVDLCEVTTTTSPTVDTTLPPRDCPPDNPNCIPATGAVGAEQILIVGATLVACGWLVRWRARTGAPAYTDG